MREFIARYILYIYLKFIKEDDMDIYKKWALPFIYVILNIRSIYVWIASIVFSPILIFGMIFEEKYKSEIKKMIEIYKL